MRHVQVIEISSDDEDEYETIAAQQPKRRKLIRLSHYRDRDDEDDELECIDDSSSSIGELQVQHSTAKQDRREQVRQDEVVVKHEPEEYQVKRIKRTASKVPLYAEALLTLKDDPGEAYDKFRKCATKERWRCGRTVYRVHQMHNDGTGVVEQTVERAQVIVENQNGNTSASLNTALTYLGDCCYYGRGMRTSLKQALLYFQLAASGGDVHGSAMMGFARASIYEFEEAVGHYKVAAEAGHALAMFELSQIYQAGLGRVLVDKARARHWFSRCLQVNYPPAHLEMARRMELKGCVVDALQQYDLGAKGGMRACMRARDNISLWYPDASPFGRWTPETHMMFPVLVRDEIFAFLGAVHRTKLFPHLIQQLIVSFIATSPGAAADRKRLLFKL